MHSSGCVDSAHLNFLGREEVPVVHKRPALGLLVVDQDLVCVVGLEDQRVDMGEHIVLHENALQNDNNEDTTRLQSDTQVRKTKENKTKRRERKLQRNKAKANLATNLLLDEQVLALVVEDDVHLLVE